MFNRIKRERQERQQGNGSQRLTLSQERTFDEFSSKVNSGEDVSADREDVREAVRNA